MKNSSLHKSIIPTITVVFLLLAVAWMAGSFDDKVAPTLIKNKIDKSLNSDDSYTISSIDEAIFEPTAATITAKYATIISSRIIARIDSIKVRAGEFVKKDDLLITLEQSDLESKVLQAKEKIKGTQARYTETKQNFERATDLYKKKLLSEYNLDKTRADFQSSDAELTAAKQSLKQAQTTLSYATLRSPIDGRVVDRFAEPGNTAQPGEKLLTLYNPLSLWVEAKVREQLALTLKKGQQIKVELPSLNKTIDGVIEEIVPAANTGSRSFLIKASIRYNENLLPGMYSRVLIPAGNQQKIYVPHKMVAHVGQLNFLWVLTDGTIQRRFVRLGNKRDNEMISIISGVIAGDIIVSPKDRN